MKGTCKKKSTFKAVTRVSFEAFRENSHMALYAHFPKRMPVFFYFYIRNVPLDVIKVFYSPANAQMIFSKTILKFTLKYSRTMLYAHINKDTTNTCSHITTDSITQMNHN